MFLLPLQIGLLMLHLLATTTATPEVVEGNLVARATIIVTVTLTRIPLPITKITLAQIKTRKSACFLDMGSFYASFLATTAILEPTG